MSISASIGMQSTQHPGGALVDQLTVDEEGLEWPFALDSMAAELPGWKLYYIVLVATMVEPYNSLKQYRQRACTGTFVRFDLVLTLATCVQLDPPYDPDPAQTVIYRRDGIPLRSLKIFLLPKFNYAVIVTENSEQTEFPTLPAGHLSFSDVRNSCFLAGYGNQDRLRLTNFKVKWMENLQAREISCRNSTKYLCLNFERLIPCRGDRGAPLICGGRVYALYTPRSNQSFDYECIEEFITRFQLVSSGVGLIRQIVESSSTALKWLNDPWYLVGVCVIVLAVIGGIYYCLIEALQNSFRLSVRGETDVTTESLASRSMSASSSRKWTKPPH